MPHNHGLLVPQGLVRCELILAPEKDGQVVAVDAQPAFRIVWSLRRIISHLIGISISHDVNKWQRSEMQVETSLFVGTVVPIPLRIVSSPASLLHIVHGIMVESKLLCELSACNAPLCILGLGTPFQTMQGPAGEVL